MSGPTPPWLRSLIIQYLGILNSLAHLGPAVQDFFPKRRNAPVHCDIHFRPWKNQLRLQQTQRRCGEMADATDLKIEISRFRRFAPLINSSTIYLGKSSKFPNFFYLSEREQ